MGTREGVGKTYDKIKSSQVGTCEGIGETYDKIKRSQVGTCEGVFSDAVDSFEKAYNRSIRMMWKIPLQIHSYLIVPLSEQSHMSHTYLFYQ